VIYIVGEPYFKWTPHPYRDGGFNISPGFKGEQIGVEDKNTHMGTPHP